MQRFFRTTMAALLLSLPGFATSVLFAADDQTVSADVRRIISASCLECHAGDSAEAGLDLKTLDGSLTDAAVRARWIRIHDRVRNGEMPPDNESLSPSQRQALTSGLASGLHAADWSEVRASGRGPMRRLNRDEYQQNLRDVLQLPLLDIRDMLPEDREGHHFNKTADRLDISRVQLTAYLDAAESALLQALASGIKPPAVTRYRAVGRKLFEATSTFGNREAMFFARDQVAIDNKILSESPDDPAIELALFRSAHWPYYGYPQGFVARLPGEYRVRFSGRAVRQMPGFRLEPATRPLAMTFRARKPSGPDVSGDVRATGGLIDLQPEIAAYETTIQLKPGETFEYSLLGLPVPLARNVNGGPPTYRFPPFPDDGQRGAAFQWLEVEGPLSPEKWPPESHRNLFAELPMRTGEPDSGLPVEIISENPPADARRLLRRFVQRAARQPVTDEDLEPFEHLVLSQLEQGAGFTRAVLAGYKAFLCSSQFLFLHEPLGPDRHFAVASRLSHFLTNSRPDARLLQLAQDQQLQNREVLTAETRRLIDGPGFDRFIRNFTDYWLNLRHVYRDEPDVRLHPEYRFDAYLIESMERETRTFVSAMFQQNLPVDVLIDSDFVFVNDRLAEHYGLSPTTGSAIRRVSLPVDSPYGGLMTQAAILKVTANGTSTSPVVRGAWVMDRLLGQPPPPPPASVPAVEPDIRGASTIRELLALHTQSESCASCHARFDPVGLALENFDVLGGWRDRYRGMEAGKRVSGIDRAGHDFAFTIAGPVDASGQLPDGRRFADIHELKELLKTDRRQIARNLVNQLAVYSTGTPIRFSDRSEVEMILDECAAGGYRTRDLVERLIQSRIFLGPEGLISDRDETNAEKH